MTAEMHPTTIATDGVTLHAVQGGPEGGAPVLLLHGFPEPWSCWRHQLAPLAGAGFRVTAPDQRGYNRSDKPPRVADYRLELLAADVVGLIDAAGRPKVALVGHDWGGIVAWWVAITHPERVERLAILNAPHPVAFRRHLRTHPGQLLRSWYVFFFQLPLLPEANFRRRDFAPLARALRATSRPGTFRDEDLDDYRRAWSEPGALRSMVHWYRAALRHPPRRPADPRVHVPTLLIWGMRDRFLSPGLLDASLAYCDDARAERIDAATHWVQHEQPERVNRLLIDFLGAGHLPPDAPSARGSL